MKSYPFNHMAENLLIVRPIFLSLAFIYVEDKEFGLHEKS